MAIREGDVIVVTSPYIPGYRIVRVLGVVLGITVRSRGLGGRFLAGLRALAGGEIKEFTELAEQARRQAIERMIQHAKELGANAVISFRLDSNEISEYMDEIIAYGTAVIVEPEQGSGHIALE
ncbi:heavy metal-binding domain-containing protein [Vulcanisaeta sp. JCM 16161]|uniref:YbjQ family protein n=1 Tax=Vulcanisaeta sp. JCM 16161 TaxID=1295372 RepID=UPI0006D05181|nr:heavy metal-binding domain-containing protein [Vulcanisaeta sp. JCM 16161]